MSNENDAAELDGRDDGEAEDDALWNEMTADDSIDTATDESETDDAEGSEDGDEQQEAEQEDESPDIWAGATEAQRAAYEQAARDAQQWQHKYKSDEGRFRAAQQKLSNEAQKLQQKPSAAQAAKVSGKLAQIREEWPEFADGIEEAIAGVKEQLESEFTGRLAPIYEAEQSRYVSSQYAALEAAHPDWMEIKDDSKFRQWVESQPDPVKAMSRSYDANEVSALLDFYKRAANNNAADRAERQAKAKQVSAKRDARLAASASVKGSPPAAQGIPDDEDAAWNYFVAKKERRAKR